MQERRLSLLVHVPLVGFDLASVGVIEPTILDTAHDIAADYADHGIGEYTWTSLPSQLIYMLIDVTMWQRSPTYILSLKCLSIILGGSFCNAVSQSTLFTP